jgi:hypothetical protein
MYSSQLARCVRTDPFIDDDFIGVFASDRLRVPQTLPAALIVNNQDSSQPGEHWISVYIDGAGVGCFIDSVGMPPSVYSWDIANFMDNNCLYWSYNPRTIQSMHSNICGQYALFFLWHMCRGSSMHQTLAPFTENRLYNDSVVSAFVLRQFGYIARVERNSFADHQSARTFAEYAHRLYN